MESKIGTFGLQNVRVFTFGLNSNINILETCSKYTNGGLIFFVIKYCKILISRRPGNSPKDFALNDKMSHQISPYDIN